jgi:hypothetical protein
MRDTCLRGQTDFLETKSPTVLRNLLPVTNSSLLSCYTISWGIWVFEVGQTGEYPRVARYVWTSITHVL